MLGVPYDASDEQIKKAYRTLARKYHPDANVDNPNKEETTAKFQQVQQAYDMIMKGQRSGDSSWNYQQGGYQQNQGYSQGGYQQGSYGYGQGDDFDPDWYQRQTRRYGYDTFDNGRYCLNLLPFCFCFFPCC